MTTQADITGDPSYSACLDHGFVGLVESMGDDAAIVAAARLSYRRGTKRVDDDMRRLIRYLMRHEHWSPFEMVHLKLHMRMPIFVARQLFRHRTHSANEESARYSILSDDFYVPEWDVLQPQSQTNKQGRAGAIADAAKTAISDALHEHNERSYHLYETLLGTEEGRETWLHERGSNGEPHPFAADYPGLTRELARTVLPVSVYTEFYWSQNLRNLLHLIALRLDESHAQYEIRVYAQAIYDLVQPLCPIALEAFEDYVRQAVRVSRMERDLIRHLMHSTSDASFEMNKLIGLFGSKGQLAANYNMSVRELNDFCSQWQIDLAA